MEVKSHYWFVLDHLNKQRNNGQFCDVRLEVEGKCFAVHRNVLAACSRYFHNMFTAGETYEEPIPIKGIPASALEAMLEFIYTSKLNLNETNLESLLAAASMMQVLDALQNIKHFMKSKINLQNCLRFLKLGNVYSVASLKEETLQLITNHFQDLLKDDQLYNIGVEDMKKLLSLDDLNVKHEKTVFEFLISWVNQDIEKREQFFTELFTLVRLQFVSQQFLADRVRKHKLVRKYSECKESVDDAFFFFMSPETFLPQKPRKHYLQEPNAIALLQSQDPEPSTFDIATKVWTKISAEISSSAQNEIVMKDNYAVAASGDTLTVFGGNDSTGHSSTEVFQLKSSRWSRLSSMKSAREGAAAVVVSENEIWVLGGETHNTSFASMFLFGQRRYLKSSGEIFRKNKCENVFNLKIHRRSYAAAHVVQDFLYFIGGYAAPADQHGETLTYAPRSNTMDICNTTDHSWEEGAPMVHARVCFGSAVVGQQIYVLGGTSNNTAEVFNAASDQWTALTSNLPTGVQECTACCAKGQIYVIGSRKWKHLFCYKPSTKNWTNENQEVPFKGKLVSFLLRKASTKASVTQKHAHSLVHVDTSQTYVTSSKSSLASMSRSQTKVETPRSSLTSVDTSQTKVESSKSPLTCVDTRHKKVESSRSSLSSVDTNQTEVESSKSPLTSMHTTQTKAEIPGSSLTSVDTNQAKAEIPRSPLICVDTSLTKAETPRSPLTSMDTSQTKAVSSITSLTSVDTNQAKAESSRLPLASVDTSQTKTESSKSSKTSVDTSQTKVETPRSSQTSVDTNQTKVETPRSSLTCVDTRQTKVESLRASRHNGA